MRVLIIIVFLLLAACADSPSNTEVMFIEHPQGGDLVRTLTARVRISIDPTGASSAIGSTAFTFQWMTTNGAHQTEVVDVPWAQAEPNPDVAEHIMSFSAPAGLYLDKTFWARVQWSDHGDLRQLDSKAAICAVP